MDKKYTVNELAKLAGISVRTLHYYDEIDLFKPDLKSESNYRLYTIASLERLWNILFFKELDFSLSKIKEILNSSNDCSDILMQHKELLICKRERLDNIITSIDKTIKKGFDVEMMKAFDKKEYEKHKKEVIEKYGDVGRESIKRTDEYSEDKFNSLNKEMMGIFKGLALNMDNDVNSPVVKKLVIELQDHITSNYYDCTDEILKGLGQLYVCDERFKKNIDSIKDGLAEFTREAIDCYIKNK